MKLESELIKWNVVKEWVMQDELKVPLTDQVSNPMSSIYMKESIFR